MKDKDVLKLKTGDKMTYYLSETPLKANHAGSKARLDADRIIGEFCGELLHIEIKNYSSKLAKLKDKVSPNYLSKLKKLTFTKGQDVLLQYPFYFDRITNKVLKKFALQNETTLLLHDVDALRNFGKTSVGEEINFLNSAKLLITHNEFMTARLKELGVTTKTTELNLFDYLLTDIPNIKRNLGKTVAFPGNLQKSAFLQDENIAGIDATFHLYGGENPNLKAANLHYIGGFSPEVIPHKLTESFGLVWDGESVSTCAGSFGEYLRYNNPHKLSLYIAACLPVITWNEAAIAKFIKASNIGFCVDSLEEIPHKIENMTDKDYEEFLVNLEVLQKKVVKGEYLRETLCKALG